MSLINDRRQMKWWL